MINIKILTGSTRPNRFNIQPAQWIYDLAKSKSDANFDLIDLQEVNLPFLDETLPPMHQNYSKEHTKKWSKTINDSDGFIFITPEYNHSVSPVLKNAVDYLFHEWHYKPVSFVSYGSLAGGARAVEHWRGIAAEIKLYDLREQILLPNYWERLDAKGLYQFSEKEETLASQMIESLTFWAGVMKEARNKINNAK